MRDKKCIEIEKALQAGHKPDDWSDEEYQSYLCDVAYERGRGNYV